MKYLVTPNRMTREMNRVMNNLFTSPFDVCTDDNCFIPRVDVRETEDDLLLNFEVPGIEKGDIKVTVADGFLTVAGERKTESSDNGDGYVRREIHSGSFSRAFTLPDTVDAGQIMADYKNGILKVSIPRKEEVKPKEIEVNVS